MNTEASPRYRRQAERPGGVRFGLAWRGEPLLRVTSGQQKVLHCRSLTALRAGLLIADGGHRAAMGHPHGTISPEAIHGVWL
jgi:hypothetical protein